MSNGKVLAGIEPEVFGWLKESSGWSSEEIAKRLKISEENIRKIEAGKKKITFRQMKELAGIFKRPVAAFLLAEPKEEKPAPKDFRMIPGKEGKFDKKTLLVLRKARWLQELGKELALNINYSPEAALPEAGISADSKEAAESMRSLLGMDENVRRKFRNSYEMFNHLRNRLEDFNIAVFQFSMPVEDARGFVFADEYPFVIVVNTKDSIEARIFSLMHEFGHILLRQSAIDLPDVSVSKGNVEMWCNEFSASFLLPKKTAIEIFESERGNLTEADALKRMSARYKVSKAMLLVKMLDLGYIKKDEYDGILDRYKRVQKEEIRAGIPSDVRCLSEMGSKFVSLVADNYGKKKITYTDALNYLSIKSRNFDKVLAKVKR